MTDNIPSITVRMQSGHTFELDGPQAAQVYEGLRRSAGALIFVTFDNRMLDSSPEIMIVPKYVESYEWNPHGNASTILRRPISDLNLTTRTESCLLEASIYTIGELTNRTKEDLLLVPNMNAAMIARIDAALTDTYELGLAYD